jgi:hypothetical protein
LHAASIVRATIATFQALGYARMPCVRVVETQGVEYAATKRPMDGSVAAFFLGEPRDASTIKAELLELRPRYPALPDDGQQRANGARWSGMGTVTLPASVRRCMTIWLPRRRTSTNPCC